jgi:hypothetical protein
MAGEEATAGMSGPVGTALAASGKAAVASPLKNPITATRM